VQEYLGLTPRAEQADFKELPALKSFFFPLKLRAVISKDVADLEPLIGCLTGTMAWKASLHAIRQIRAIKKETVFIMVTLWGCKCCDTSVDCFHCEVRSKSWYVKAMFDYSFLM
jgi:hypothetical protein